MLRGSKISYTSKQKCPAGHIDESDEKRGVPKEAAESRAGATVNKIDGGGKKSGAGRSSSTRENRAKNGARGKEK